jgi:large subunit ribosomal protein L32e
VFNVADLSQLNPEMQAARIAGTVGRKKRMEIRAKAKEMKLRLLNR